MGVLAVLSFETEARTQPVVRRLRLLHDEGMLTLFGFARIASKLGSTGAVASEPVDRAAAAAAASVGAAVGALVSLLQGPLSMATQAVPSGLIGAMRDLSEVGLDAGFLEQVWRDLKPGGGAIVCELEEIEPLALDRLAVNEKGRIFRHRLAGVLNDRRLIHEIQSLQRELLRLEREAASDTISTVQRSTGVELGDVVRRAKSLGAALRREAAAKSVVAEQQARTLSPELSRVVRDRVEALTARLQRRADRLERAAFREGAGESGRAVRSANFRHH
jgi:uncharacterized membrane protein